MIYVTPIKILMNNCAAELLSIDKVTPINNLK